MPGQGAAIWSARSRQEPVAACAEAGTSAARVRTSASRDQGRNVTRSPTLARTGSCLGPDADLLALHQVDGLAAGRLAQPGTEVIAAGAARRRREVRGVLAGVGHEGRTGGAWADLPVEVARRPRQARLDSCVDP